MRFRNLNRDNTGFEKRGCALPLYAVCVQVPHGGQLRLLLCEDRRSNPPSSLTDSLTPTHRRPTHPAADDRSKNLRPKRNIRTAMNHEIMLYGIAQKEQLGFDKAVEECSAAPPLKPSSHSHTLTHSSPRSQSTE